MTDTTIDQIAAELSDYKRAYTTLLGQHKDRFIEISGLCEERDALKAALATAEKALETFAPMVWAHDAPDSEVKKLRLSVSFEYQEDGQCVGSDMGYEISGEQALSARAALDQIKALSASSDKP